jgi:hypothetical protein
MRRISADQTKINPRKSVVSASSAFYFETDTAEKIDAPR